MTEEPRTNDGWDLLHAALATAREIDTGLNDTGIKAGQLRALSDRLAELSAAWKAHMDAGFAEKP